jgi:hypothetical protein
MKMLQLVSRRRGLPQIIVAHLDKKWAPGFLSPGLKRGRGVTLITHPHVVPSSPLTYSGTALALACILVKKLLGFV